ncbi:MAG: phosphosulfolactate synthase [Bacteroidetes bacterium CG2_30_32_10]|nr:MAG: phosphosulfolactate synthase [Bacteroidetes bacterium CG2_30_32_10]
MNFKLPYIPERQNKPRTNGLTMVMDKGLSIREAENIISASNEYIDFVKLGFGTSAVVSGVEEKIRTYQKANIKVYLGGTLFEAFVVRNMFSDYLKLLDKYQIDTVEVSDGSMSMKHEEKCSYIKELSKNRFVLSEVGAKDASIVLSSDKWIAMMEKELEAGSKVLIAEARESGNVGIYNSNGTVDTNLIDKLLSKIPQAKILWEAPLKTQQVWFIKQYGANVNLGNIAPNEIIPLETLRLGLRGDTFFNFLPENLKEMKLTNQ